MKNTIWILVLFLGLTSTLSILCQDDSDFYTERKPKLVMAKAIFLAKPVIPSDALARRVSGSVLVKVLIDEKGNVVSAESITGDSIFHAAASAAAMQSKFTPTLLDGKPVKVGGTITFNFVRFDDWERIGAYLEKLVSGGNVKGYPRKRADINWQGFEEERDEYNDLLKDEAVDGKSERAKNLVIAITDKLERWNPREYWYFRLGRATERLAQARTAKNFKPALIGLGSLVNEAPSEIPLDRVSELKQIIAEAASKKLTEVERQAVITSLIESYSRKLTTM